jgi:hypothetical protein
MIQRKYSQDVDMKDKLNLLKQQINRTVEKEVYNFNKNLSNFQTIKSSLAKKSETEYNEYNEMNERNELLNTNDEEFQKFKVSDKQIKYMEDISNYRKDKFENIYSQTLMVQKITNDISKLTHQQDKKIEKIGDDIVPVLINAKETYKKLLETSIRDQKFKSNNCCIIAIIVFAIFFLLLIFINLNRG